MTLIFCIYRFARDAFVEFALDSHSTHQNPLLISGRTHLNVLQNAERSTTITEKLVTGKYAKNFFQVLQMLFGPIFPAYKRLGDPRL